MKNILLISIMFCAIVNNINAQTSNIAHLIEVSVLSYIHYRDSLYGQLLAPEKAYDQNYILPELIGADKIHFDSPSKDMGPSVIWVTARHSVRSLLNKKRTREYRCYYRVALNIENGELVVYITSGYQQKIGETLHGRYSYGLKDGVFCLHSVKYLWNDEIVAYDNPNIDRMISNYTYCKMFELFQDEFGYLFSDTINVIRSTTIWGGEYPEIANVRFVECPYFTKTKNISSEMILSIDYTFNEKSEIICFFRLIECAKQRGKYHRMQPNASDRYVITLSPNCKGIYQISAYGRINSSKSCFNKNIRFKG